MKLDERTYKILLATVTSRLLAARVQVYEPGGAFTAVKEATRYGGYLMAAVGLELDLTTPKDPRSAHIGGLGIAPSTVENLQIMGIHTVGHLSLFTEKGLRQCRRLRRGQVDEIIRKLKKRGISLASEKQSEP